MSSRYVRRTEAKDGHASRKNGELYFAAFSFTRHRLSIEARMCSNAQSHRFDTFSIIKDRRVRKRESSVWYADSSSIMR